MSDSGTPSGSMMFWRLALRDSVLSMFRSARRARQSGLLATPFAAREVLDPSATGTFPPAVFEIDDTSTEPSSAPRASSSIQTGCSIANL